MPQYAAGIRIEPPVSVPSAKSQTPAATSAAEPLLEPPDVRLDVERVEGHAVGRIDAARGVLEQVRLAEQLGPGRAEAGDDGRVALRRRADADGGGVRRHDSAYVDVVLDRHRHTVQRPVDALLGRLEGRDHGVQPRALGLEPGVGGEQLEVLPSRNGAARPRSPG